MLIHAFTHVPFYKEKYSKAGFQLIDFQNFKQENLSSLPFLEKQELRKFGETKLLSDNRDKGVFIAAVAQQELLQKFIIAIAFIKFGARLLRREFANGRGLIGIHPEA